MRPSSSPPQNAKRTRLVGAMSSSAICSAVSRIAAEPLPLSLMPGPSSTESRWAPTSTVRSYPPGGRVGEHVEGRRRLDRGVDGHSHLQSGGVRQRFTDGERRAHRRNGGHRRIERAEDDAEAVVVGILVALVEHDHRRRTGRGGVVDLVAEEARAAFGSARCCPCEPGEVTGLAAARRGAIADEVDVDGLDGGGHVVGTGVGHRREVLVFDIHGGSRRRAPCRSSSR